MNILRNRIWWVGGVWMLMYHLAVLLPTTVPIVIMARLMPPAIGQHIRQHYILLPTFKPRVALLMAVLTP